VLLGHPHLVDAARNDRKIGGDDRRFVTGTGVADGDARIRVGSVVKLEGLGNLFNGNYYVTRVRHSYDGTYGFRTTFDVERPGSGQPKYI